VTDPDLGRRLLDEGLVRRDDLLAPLAAADATLPQKLGRYELQRLLGKGASGEVWLARDPSVNREVAVKVLRQADPRSRREIEILGALRHPNIVAIHDAGAEGGFVYFVMDRIDGRTLAEAQDLPIRDRVAILRDVASACHAAHDKGIVHRDLKPSNILLDRANRPFVSDFGIATTARAEDRLTVTGTAVGTPHYMSPEQASGRELDTRSDVFSLGVILYEMLAGRVPFQGKTFFAIARQVIEDDPPGVPGDLGAVALKAMEKDPARRYATARAMADDLSAWLDGRPVVARPPGLGRRVFRGARRHPAVLALAGAAFVGLVMLAWVQVRNAVERLRELQRIARVDDEIVKLYTWDAQLYKPPRLIGYDELARSAAALEEIVRAGGLPSAHLAKAHYGIGRARARMGRTDLAIAPLGEAIRLAPAKDAALYHWWRARVRWEPLLREAHTKNESAADRMAKDVRADLEAAGRLGLTDPWEREFASVRLAVLGEPDPEALKRIVETCDKLRESKEKPGEEVAKFLGDIALLRRDSARAVALYAEALDIRKCYVEAKTGLAMAHLSRENADERRAEEALGHALGAVELNPAYAETYLFLASALRNALRSGPMEWSRDQARAEAYLRIGDRILDILRRGREARPDLPAIDVATGAAQLIRGTALAVVKQPPLDALAEAASSFEAYLKHDPRSYDARMGLAYAHGITADQLVKQGQDGTRALARAKAELAAAAEIEPTSVEPHRWLGYAALIARDWDGAIAAWRKAIEVDGGRREEFEKLIEGVRREKRK